METSNRDIATFLEILHEPGHVFEVRAPNTSNGRGGDYVTTVSGYFNDIGIAAAAIADFDSQKRTAGIYVTLNPVRADLLARSCNRLRSGAKSTTSDLDILRCRWMLVDVDPVRPSGVSSNDAELKQAIATAEAIRTQLGDVGWPEPLVAMSGNGSHLLYRLDLPLEENGLIGCCLHALAQQYDTDRVHVDTSVGNPARITKVIGTLTRKGDDLRGAEGIADRPHRLSQIVSIPESVEAVVSRDLLSNLAATGKKPIRRRRIVARSSSRHNGHTVFDVVGNGVDDVAAYLSRHGVDIKARRELAKGSTALHLEACPVTSRASEGNSDMSVIVHADGCIIYKNQHTSNGANQLTWIDVREALEPGYRAHRQAVKPQDTDVDQIVENLSSSIRSMETLDDEALGRPLVALAQLTPSLCEQVLNSNCFNSMTPVQRVALGDLIEMCGFELERSYQSKSPSSPVGSTGTDPPSTQTAIERITPFGHFPVQVLPEPLRTYVSQASDAIGCDPCYIALPLLSALATTIGNTRQIQLKPGWTEPSILWTAIIGESGTLKSPALSDAIKPLRRLQREALDRHKEALRQHRAAIAKYETEKAEWKKTRAKKGEDPPQKPEEPKPERLVVSDTTLEAMAVILEGSPRGVLLGRDELSGWFGSFGRYSGSGGAEVAHWLEFHRGDELVVDRKTGNKTTIQIDHASVSITGGIQPQVLRRALGQEHFENGLAPRFLLAMPPRRRKRWTEKSVPQETRDRIDAVFDGLSNLDFEYDDERNRTPKIAQLSQDGKQAWVQFYESFAKKQNDIAGGDLAAAFSKLEGACARLAMLVHLVRWEEGDKKLEDSEQVDRTSIEIAASLVEWFAYETERVYSALREPEGDRTLRELFEWVVQRDGRITVRKLQQSNGRYRCDRDKAESDLEKLAKAGLGNWVDIPSGPKGGRPTREFVICLDATQRNLDQFAETKGFRCVDESETVTEEIDS